MDLSSILTDERVSKFLDELAPLLPVLKRMAESATEDLKKFVEALVGQEYPQANSILATHMTHEERLALVDTASQRFFSAAKEVVEDRKLATEVLLKCLVYGATLFAALV